ncbi:MAG: c-type cytochrome [Phenylobacterium sp.]|uniref:c-type cytochrome n=1 Tax=Phenylobacterium sp. TaxID=1871053 RepID=UPI0025E334A4|nr:cytochrome c [Phenylobacterium sp.]MBI1200584.1 c-type cytochrome [Phenylobacterium sp.]
MRRILTLAVTAAAFAAVPALADEAAVGRPPNPKTGEEVYRVVCQACHMADGKGAVGAGTFPALAGNPRLASPVYPIVMVEKGKGGMPYFSDSLTPEQVAAVVNYIRTSFGNTYPGTVTADQVKPFATPPAGSRR